MAGGPGEHPAVPVTAAALARAAAGAVAAGWARLDPAQRPDFASVNLSEAGYAELITDVGALGIGVEAGVWSPADADRLATVDTSAVVRVLVEVLDGPASRIPGTAPARADEILARLDALGLDRPRLLHGEEAACWPLIVHAGRLGLATRIGLEDILAGPDGEPVTDNADLVRLAVRLLTAVDRDR